MKKVMKLVLAILIIIAVGVAAFAVKINKPSSDSDLSPGDDADCNFPMKDKLYGFGGVGYDPDTFWKAYDLALMRCYNRKQEVIDNQVEERISNRLLCEGPSQQPTGCRFGSGVAHEGWCKLTFCKSRLYGGPGIDRVCEYPPSSISVSSSGTASITGPGSNCHDEPATAASADERGYRCYVSMSYDGEYTEYYDIDTYTCAPTQSGEPKVVEPTPIGGEEQ